MTREALLLLRMAGQHLLLPAKPLQVVSDLCGLQAQFLSHALGALSLRAVSADPGGMVKSWTNRGTLHLFAEADLPLFLHRDRHPILRPQDTMESDVFVSARRKQHFAGLILDAVSSGTESRAALKALCQSHGMTEEESASLFDPWGGMIRALCEEGRLCHLVQEEKAYRLCPAFEPMERDAALLELARRYYRNFGPATIRDAANFLGCTQKEIRKCLDKLPAEVSEYQGQQFFRLKKQEATHPELPACLFLPGFDPFLLGYHKKDSLILPQEQLRNVYTLSGIVRPVVLLHGMAAGTWNLKSGTLTVTCFPSADQALIRQEAEAAFPGLRGLTIL